MIIRWDAKVPKRIQFVRFRLTIARSGLIELGTNDDDAPGVWRMEVVTHVELQIETIQFDKRINADTFFFHNLQSLQADHCAITPSNKHHTLTPTPDSVSNHVRQHARVVKLFPWIKVNRIVATISEVPGHPLELPHPDKIAIRPDEDDERFRSASGGAAFTAW